MNGLSEDDIHKAVICHLKSRAMPGTFWFHPANDGKRSFATASRMKSMGMVAGIPDLIILRGGEVFGLELKSAKGRIRPSQHLIHAAMREAGARTEIVRSVEEALTTLEYWGVLKRSVSTALPKTSGARENA